MSRWRLTAPITIALAFMLSAPAGAQQPDVIRLPLTFHTQSERIPIRACLQLHVRAYPATPWWRSPAVTGAAERSLSAVIAALEAKSRPALLAVSDAPSAKDEKEFNRQVDALFGQFGVLKIASIRQAYEFDGLLVFVARLEATGGTEAGISAPFPFVLLSDGTAKYLPIRPQELTFALVQDLLGRDTVDGASLCDDLNGRFTHRVSLTMPRPGASSAPPVSSC